MKMWPPPAGPDDREPGRDLAQIGNSESLNSSQPQKSCRPTDRLNVHGIRPTQQNTTAVISSTTPPQTPGLVILLSPMVFLSLSWKHTLFSCKKGSSFQNSSILFILFLRVFFGLTNICFPVFQYKFLDNLTRYSRFFSCSVWSHLPLPEPRQQSEYTKSRVEAGEEIPPEPPSVEPAKPAREQPEPESLYVCFHYSDSA